MEAAEDHIFIENRSENWVPAGEAKGAPWQGWDGFQNYSLRRRGAGSPGARLTRLNSSGRVSGLRSVRLGTDDSAVWFKAVESRPARTRRHRLSGWPLPRSVHKLLTIPSGGTAGLPSSRGQRLTVSRNLQHGSEQQKTSPDSRSIDREHTELLEGWSPDLTFPELIEEIDPFVDRIVG